MLNLIFGMVKRERGEVYTCCMPKHIGSFYTYKLVRIMNIFVLLIILASPKESMKAPENSHKLSDKSTQQRASNNLGE